MAGRENSGWHEELYHSWKEYVQKNSYWNKYPSSRIAAGIARLEIERTGSYRALTKIIPFDPVVHREVVIFLRKLAEFEKSSRRSKLRFMVGLEAS
jgi:hypothetical protein